MALTVGVNSYISLESAATWATDRGYTTMSGAEDAALSAALIRACSHIEELPVQGWLGTLYSSTQALAWPRSNVTRGTGDWYESMLPSGPSDEETSYPQALKDAQCEEALEMLLREANSLQAKTERDRAAGIKRRRTSEGAEIEYQPEGATRPIAGAMVSLAAWNLLRTLRRNGPMKVLMP